MIKFSVLTIWIYHHKKMSLVIISALLYLAMIVDRALGMTRYLYWTQCWNTTHACSSLNLIRFPCTWLLRLIIVASGPAWAHWYSYTLPSPLIEALSARTEDRPSWEAMETKAWSTWINCVLFLISVCCFGVGSRAGLLLPARLDGKTRLSTCWWLKIQFLSCTSSMIQP